MENGCASMLPIECPWSFLFINIIFMKNTGCFKEMDPVRNNCIFEMGSISLKHPVC